MNMNIMTGIKGDKMYKQKTIVALLIIFSVSVFISCSSDSLSEYEAFVDQIIEYKCEREFECCKWNSEKEYLNKKECISYHRSIEAEKLFRIEKTSLAVNSENVEKCFNYILASNYSEYGCQDIVEIDYRTFNNSSFLENKSACEKILAGTLREGEKCHPIDINFTIDDKDIPLDECVSGFYCSPSSLSCKRLPRRTERCEDSGKICGGENICLGVKDEEAGGTKYVCRGLPSSDGSKCLEEEYCGQDLVCKRERDQDSGKDNYICRDKYTKIGRSCEDKECPEGSYCATEKDQDGQNIKICREKKNAGSSCASNSTCVSNVCNIVDEYSFDLEKGICAKNFINVGQEICKE
jgi:hypothetical protein